jgi:hypothetical protein
VKGVTRAAGEAQESRSVRCHWVDIGHSCPASERSAPSVSLTKEPPGNPSLGMSHPALLWLI